MIRKLVNLGIVLSVLWGINFFLLSNVAIRIERGAEVAAVVCVAIIFCAIVLPFIVKD